MMNYFLFLKKYFSLQESYLHLTTVLQLQINNIFHRKKKFTLKLRI